MDTQKIGKFLKQLRKEKGISQEQLAEKLNVSARTVSRWETAVTMPDLSILMQLAQLYNVELKEILDAERMEESMDQEMREMLEKVADYTAAEKERAAKVGITAFMVTFLTCVMVCVVQLMMYMKLDLILGEIVIWAVGGGSMLYLTAKNGLWDMFAKSNSNKSGHLSISAIMAAIFTLICTVGFYRLNKEMGHAAFFAVCCYAVLFILGYGLLVMLEKFSKTRKKDGT